MKKFGKDSVMKKFWLDSKIINVEEADDELTIKGYASTSDVDRAGDVILPTAWTEEGLRNFKKNPVILFNHDYNKPIGRAKSLQVDGNGLLLEAVISKSAEQYELIKEGILSTFSVGFLVKDADYNQTTDGFIIKSAELLETSVVTIPCNQDACFSLAKSFNNPKDFKEFLAKELKIESTNSQVADDEIIVSDPVIDEAGLNTALERKINMEPEELQKLAEAAAKKMFDAAEKARLDAEQKAADAAAAKQAEEVRSAAIVKSATDAVREGFEKKLAENNENFEKTIAQFKTTFEEKAAEFAAERNSKRAFNDRGTSNDDWKKAHREEIADALIMSKIARKGYGDTNYGKELMEKVNAHSTVVVPSALFETEASSTIERDIQNELVIAPLFREITMNAANMTIPVMPDAGYAEITSAQTASGTSPNGNMDVRGAAYGTPWGGVPMSEINLTTIKMIARSYLGNETEEDAIIPILPLIRESMVRAHARGVDNLLLAGNDADGNYTSGARDGLIKLARTNSRMATAAGVSTALTASALFSLRKLMGKYGVNPRDVVYIVSQKAYYELIEDAEFQDADLVGNMATKLTGEIGMVYGSKVIMSDEFAAPAASTFHALAVNRRNFIVPRLRGMTVESDYEVSDQRRLLLSSQRLGFNELIVNAPAVTGLRYAAA
jgi:HK97 family phage prohead protease